MTNYAKKNFWEMHLPTFNQTFSPISIKELAYKLRKKSENYIKNSTNFKFLKESNKNVLKFSLKKENFSMYFSGF